MSHISGGTVAAQKSEELVQLFVVDEQKADVREGDVEVEEASSPHVHLTQHFAEGQRLAGGRRLRRALFVTLSAVACGAAAFLAVVLAHYLVDGQIRHPGKKESAGQLAHHAMVAYLLLASVAAGLTAVLTLRSRLDKARGPRGFLEEWVEAAREAIIVGIALSLMAFFWRPALMTNSNFSRGTILLCVVLLALMLGCTRATLRYVLLQLRKQGHNLASVVLIGDGPSASSFTKTLEQDGCGYKVVAHVTDTELEHDVAGVLERLSTDVPIDEVVIASFSMPPEQLSQIVSHPSLREARLRAVPEMFGLPPSKVQIENFGDFPLLTLFENPVRGPHWAVKRAVDIVGSSFLLVVMGLPMLVMALMVRLTSEGGILFKQQRVGMDGKRFELLKFRSMTAGASDQVHRDFMSQMLKGKVTSEGGSGSFYKMADDPRITRVGSFLRRYSLDELPQLLNVLKGDMSLVGPRPALAYEVDLYEDWQRRRMDVLPGMTGLWQVSGRSRLSPADMLRLDVHYAETWSLFGDFLIILKTVPAILRDNAR
jgi:exopolysaccharide biosynthesis polyprenyl glycosylphosphotransferase